MFSIRSLQRGYKGRELLVVMSAVELCKGGWQEMAIQFSSQAVLNESRRRKDLRAGSWWISTVKSRCQETTGEDKAVWKSLTEISAGGVITCSSEWCVYKWSINPIPNPNPVYSHAPRTRDSMSVENVRIVWNLEYFKWRSKEKAGCFFKYIAIILIN
jgi:hypothetical protein